MVRCLRIRWLAARLLFAVVFVVEVWLGATLTPVVAAADVGAGALVTVAQIVDWEGLDVRICRVRLLQIGNHEVRSGPGSFGKEASARVRKPACAQRGRPCVPAAACGDRARAPGLTCRTLSAPGRVRDYLS
jgi:hypothetical protein